MDQKQFQDLYISTLNDHPTRARWQFTKRRASSRQFSMEMMANYIWARMQANQPQPPAPAPQNPNNKQNNPIANGTQPTKYAGTSDIAREAAIVCGCKACRAGKGHS